MPRREWGSLLRCDLHELERHAIALADGRVLRAVVVTESVGWRERPDAFRIILGVFLVRIHFGLARQLETGSLDLLDDPFLGEVAFFRALFRHGVRLRAVL